MDIQTISTFVSSVGFPIACVCYLFFAQSKEREAYERDAKVWTDAIHNNTLAITQLTEYIKARDAQNES